MIKEHGLFDDLTERRARRPTRMVSQERREDEARERQRWGAAWEDVKFLRRRDFVIYKHGRGGAYCVCDDRVITIAEMRKKASRERRLMGLEPYVADPIPYTAPIYRDGKIVTVEAMRERIASRATEAIELRPIA